MRLAALLAVLLLASAPALAQKAGRPGHFDYFVLALSWQPSWCAERGREDEAQCRPGRRLGLVVHGLWPQYERGGYPAGCAEAGPVPAAEIERMLPLMPSPALVRHQWRKHGTCFGGAAEAYFAATRKAFARLTVPEVLRTPAAPLRLTLAEVERKLAEANPGLGPGAVAVTCRGGRAAEIRVCLDKALEFRECGAEVRDTCGGEVEFPAAR